MKPYTLGIYEKAMPSSWSWVDKMAYTAAAGFDYIEMSIDETPERQMRLQWSREGRRRFCSQTQEGVPVTSICLSAHRGAPLGSHYPEIRTRGMEIMNQAIQLAYDLRITYIQLAGYDVYYKEVSDTQSKAYFTENLEKAVRTAASYGIFLGIETMENDFLNTVEKGMEYVRQINSPFLGMYPDIGNINNAGVDVIKDLECGRGHIFTAHLKETTDGIFRDMEFGTGKVNFTAAIRTLYHMGVTRWTAECWYQKNMDPHYLLQSTYNYLTSSFQAAI